MLFGTSGIRGDAKELFTNQFCFDIGRAFAKFLGKHKLEGLIAVGMDPRESSQRIKQSFSAGLQKEGRGVLDEGITPVPAMNYILIAEPKLAGSTMITGSHIRADFNGIKFFAFKKEILKEHEAEIEKIYEEIKEKVLLREESPKIITEDRANKIYEEMLLDLTRLPYPKWKIVLDLGNGCQSKIMPNLFNKIELETVVINNTLEADKFLARDTETEEAMRELQERVKEEKADLGVGFDADGDRVVFTDEEGSFIPGDYSGALISKYSDTPIIVTPVNTSQVVNYLGKPVIRTKVGSPYVVKAMEENNATFGFEANGGGISREIMMSRDAGSTTIKILNLLRKSKKSLKELVNTIPKFSLFRTKVECPIELNSLILKRAEENFKGIKIEKIDGLKVWLSESSWILFRPSSNAPEFRVFAEAKTREEVKKLGIKGIEFVKSQIKDEGLSRNL